jgi:hypothetical protein
MAFVSFEVVQQITKEVDRIMEGLQRERMDPYYMPAPEEWRKQLARHGYHIGPQDVYKAIPEVKAILGKDGEDQKKKLARTPPVPSTPKTFEADRMWNLVVLAAQAFRYGDA